MPSKNAQAAVMSWRTTYNPAKMLLRLAAPDAGLLGFSRPVQSCAHLAFVHHLGWTATDSEHGSATTLIHLITA